MKLKPINEQVIVLTGATSGIGLVTARMAASTSEGIVLAAIDAGVAVDEIGCGDSIRAAFNLGWP